MNNFELWPHTKTDTNLAFVVMPMRPVALIYLDFIKAQKIDDQTLKIEFLQTSTRNEGRGTVLLHAVAEAGIEMGIQDATGLYGPAPGMSEYVKKWYLAHGIEIIDGKLVGKLETILGQCAQVMSNYELMYDIVKDHAYVEDQNIA